LKKSIPKLRARRRKHLPSHEKTHGVLLSGDRPADKYFIDLFAGCGGFSVGLSNAGWRGLFAIEKDPMAFGTLRHNLIDGDGSRFDWPAGLGSPTHLDIHSVLEDHASFLKTLRRKVSLIVGGPPCQGFSMAGRRVASDARNDLVLRYIDFVNIVEPEFVIIENVHGMALDFDKIARRGSRRCQDISRTSHAGRLIGLLEESGFFSFANIIRADSLGIPQLRPRLVVLGIRQDVMYRIERFSRLDLNPPLDPRSAWFEERRRRFLRGKGLSEDGRVTAWEAISDLENCFGIADLESGPGDWRKGLLPHDKVADEDFYSKGTFFEAQYQGQPVPSNYVRELRKGFRGAPNSRRLANHQPATEAKFRKLLDETAKTRRRGVCLSAQEREELGVPSKKHTVVVLDPDQPSHTVTTLPDDILHYREPRILTVRENARLQSFPDWFSFTGKYTTGGDRRRMECPRYTQVGNAVPPFLSEFLGNLVAELHQLAWDKDKAAGC